MSFDQEWAELKKNAAARTRLNSAPMLETNPTQTLNEDLIVNDEELGKIGHAAYVLHGKLMADGKHAQQQSETASDSLQSDGFATGVALNKFSKAWKTQVKTLLDGCAHISNHLDYSIKSKRKEDEQIETTIRASKIADYFDVQSKENATRTRSDGPIM
ncbi:hypothetical protein [Streptomyces sp. NPDC091212]|uniref:hypothetical protein n=1 Tax=Streptomyces sp. NPDC091212 TaxID=3155191 RepID=UPI0034241C11